MEVKAVEFVQKGAGDLLEGVTRRRGAEIRSSLQPMPRPTLKLPPRTGVAPS
jgi:hypothetical protein